MTRVPRVCHLGWALVALAACTRGESAETEAPRGMVAELARAVGPAPTLGPRLSIARQPSECASEAGCRATGTPSRRVNTVAARASQAARASVAPDALHASALVDLLWADEAGTSLRRSIQYLQTAARLDPRPAPILADLSAAHLVRAERANSPRDLLEAVETAERALQKDPANRAALFNRALGLERFGLMGEAGRSWRAYLAADSTSDWADAARKRLAEVSRVPALPKAPSANATDAELAAYAVADPQGARTMGWDHLLGEWGAAVLAGDAAKAADRLHRAEVLGNTLERAGRDATLADAVRAIRLRTSNGSATRQLANAHRALSEGNAKLTVPDAAAAAQFFNTARRAGPLSPVLAAWANAHWGAGRLVAGNAEASEATFRKLGATVDQRRYPALAGRLRSLRATALLRLDRHQDAITEAHSAASLLESAGESELEAGVMGLAADASFGTGDATIAYTAAQRALDRLRRFPRSAPLHNILFALAEAASSDGHELFAIRVQSEGIQVTELIGDPLYRAEAILARARILAHADQRTLAERDLAIGSGLVARVRVLDARAWVNADRQLTSGIVRANTSPALARAALDSAIEFFDGRRIALRVVPALVGRAEARLGVNDVEGATADLDRAIEILDDRRSAMRDHVLRAAAINAAKSLIDEAAILHLNAGRNTEALRLLDRGRASLVGAGAYDDMPRGPTGEVVISYTMARDNLLIWTIAGRQVALTRIRVDTARIDRLLETVRASLELRADERTIHAGLAAIQELLVRPIRSQLGGKGSSLVIIADGELAAVPFASLWDAATGRYLVEDHPIRHAISLAHAAQGRPKTGRADQTTVVFDPAFDESISPELVRLAGAAEEAKDVARHYARAEIVAGAAATPSAMTAVLARAEIIHYAGHAVFDDEFPHRSFLALAPEPNSDGRLRAERIAALNLGVVRLVVLSACNTVRSGPGRAGGYMGLAGAFLSGGANGVLGSLWRVDDNATSMALKSFHHWYSKSDDAPRSLRFAQLSMIRGPSAEFRSPAAWAGFRYTGP